MARTIPPTLVSYTELAWNTTGAPKSTAAITWKAGDVIVVIGGCESDTGTATLGTPTATGLTFTKIQTNTAAASCTNFLATAIAVTGGSSVITCTNSNGSVMWGMSVWVYRGSDGVGASVEQHTTTKNVKLTPVDSHSAYAWGAFDFSANNADAYLLPTPSNIDERTDQGTSYTTYVADILDMASAAPTLFGITGGVTVGTIAIVAAEILGSSPPPNFYSSQIAANLGALNSAQSGQQLVRTSAGVLYVVTVVNSFVRVYRSTNSGYTWTQQDYSNAPKASSSIVSAAIDGSDNLHIAYAKSTTQAAYVSFLTATDTYGRIENAVAVTATISSVAIAVDSNSIPHVAATSSATTTVYANRVGATWQPSITIGSKAGTNIDLQIDWNNCPVISYVNTTDTAITVALGNKNNVSAFSTANVVASGAFTSGGGTTLSIDASGNTWLGYQSGADGPVQLVKHVSTDAWSTWQTPVGTGYNGKSLSLAADANDIYLFYERNLGGIAYDRYDTVNSRWLGETIIQTNTSLATTNIRFHNPFVKWSNYFNNGDSGANNSGQDLIEYLFDDGSTVYYSKLNTIQLSEGFVEVSFQTPAGAFTTSTSSTSSSTSTSISTSSTSSSTSTSQSTSTSSTSTSTSRSTSTSSTSSSTSISTSSTSSSTSTSLSTSTSSTSTSTSQSTSTSSTSSSTSVSSTSSSISTSSTSTSQSTSTSSTSTSTSASTSISTSSTSSSTSVSISTSSTSSSTSISTSSTSSSTSISTSTSLSTSSTSSSTSVSTSSTSSSTSTSSTSSSISTSSTSSSISTSSTSSSTSTSQSTSTSSTSTSTSRSTSTSSTSSSISTSSTSSSISTSSTSSSISTSSTSSSTSVSTSSTSSSISTSTTLSLTTSTSSTSSSTSLSTSTSSTSTSISSTSSSTSISTSSTSSSTSTSSTSSSISTSSTSTSQSTSTSSTSTSTSKSTSTSSTSTSTSQSTSTSSTSTSTSKSTSTSSTSRSTSTSLSTSTTVSITTSTSSTSSSSSTSSTSTSSTTTLPPDPRTKGQAMIMVRAMRYNIRKDMVQVRQRRPRG